MPSLFHLASGSLRSSYRCLPAGLVAIEGLCQPPMVPNREGTSPGANPTSTDSPPGTSLEDSAMVLTPTVDGSGMPLPSQGGHGDHAQPGQSTNDTNSTSRMEYLRKRYRDQELSEEATTLMLKSWREKTNKSYDSLFGRWYSWCNRREADPFSRPITDIVNFLATLPAKTNLQDHARILQESCMQDLHAICPFSCTILHQFLQDLAKNVQEMQVIILAATLAKSCTISCKICARLCKNRARKGTYRVQVLHARFLQDSCTILHDLASSFLLGCISRVINIIPTGLLSHRYMRR